MTTILTILSKSKVESYYHVVISLIIFIWNVCLYLVIYLLICLDFSVLWLSEKLSAYIIGSYS